MNEGIPPGQPDSSFPVLYVPDSVLRLPKRIRDISPNVHGLLCGHGPQHVRVARNWLSRVCEIADENSDPILLSLSEMHGNALRHSASGLPGGTVKIQLERQMSSYVLSVTDNGPRPGKPVTLPVVRRRSDDDLYEGGRGLVLLDRLAARWKWKGRPGGPLTVFGIFDLRGRTHP